MARSKTYRFIDLFAGIGGFHLGLSAAGGRCVFASEWDTHARATYEHNFKVTDKRLFTTGHFVGDITKVDPASIPDFDILAGGFPCQPFSHAGFKKGFADSRGTLFFNIAEIIRVKRPRAFFLENVRHLLKHDNGRTFAAIKDVLTNQLGYSFDARLVRASDFGLPQHRPRLYMVGFRDPDSSFTWPTPVPLSMTMSDVFGAPCSRAIGFTLRVGGRGSGLHDRRNWDAYLVDGALRRLGPREGKLMQGFPDDFEFPVSPVQAMKQLGNSVAVPAVEAVARQIVKTLRTADKHALQQKSRRVE